MTTQLDTETPVRAALVGSSRFRRRRLAEHLGSRLLLATDLSEASRPAEQRAIAVAADGARQLIIVGVVPPEDAPPDAHRRLAALVRTARARGIRTDGTVFVSEEPARVVLRAAEVRGADAIVVGHGPWCRPSPAPAVCGHLVNHATCPVLVIGSHEG